MTMTRDTILDELTDYEPRLTLCDLMAALASPAYGAWEFCDRTPGCTLARGHGGDCKLAKGL